mmetsp:Transcript_28376/g.68304  ORF Transcript_28376/g.68304 Transcript_28376/m.68304 type:complete len:104 (+) Transcript_28376:430-741(+)|eukprot:CAMPEP_0181088416 /NCGR_PEP_ID=MMETSP1071-20121207/6775_1 /TAXON_ID=35127 /ORGANISM="Thalassiosira sp., Strain NH16" /LENGTH=103 /DNA_ID=CAMNT_0023170331 /DNA_START=310 /DNA_END=621 /DNA_ORIENTATION=+
MRFCLVLFILNMFVKMALLYSAMTVAVAASSGNSDKTDSISEGGSVSMNSLKSPEICHNERRTPSSTYPSEVRDHDIDVPSPRTPNISGLISPVNDPRSSYSP